jgi:hypothetical protein
VHGERLSISGRRESKSHAQAGSHKAGRRARAIPFLLAALAVAAPARGEEPLWGEIASTLGQGFLNVTTHGLLRQSKPYRHHGGPVSMSIEQMDAGIGAEYGLSSDLDLRVRVPYLSQTIEERYAGQTTRHAIDGLGETEVGAKWRFHQAIEERHKDELALLADLKLPTGSNDLRDQHGAQIDPHLQPNSGNLGLAIGLAADRHTSLGGYWLSGGVRMEVGSPRYRRGSMLEVHASMGRRLHPLTSLDRADWMGIVGLHFHRMGIDTERGRTLVDSGGSILSAEFGFVGSRRNYSARLGILLPLRTDLGLAHAPPRHEIQASLRTSF